MEITREKWYFEFGILRPLFYFERKRLKVFIFDRHAIQFDIFECRWIFSYFFEGDRILLRRVRVGYRSRNRLGGLYLPRKFWKKWKIKLLKSSFPLSLFESHFNPPSKIKRTFAAREGCGPTHLPPPPPPVYSPEYCAFLRNRVCFLKRYIRLDKHVHAKVWGMACHGLSWQRDYYKPSLVNHIFIFLSGILIPTLRWRKAWDKSSTLKTINTPKGTSVKEGRTLRGTYEDKTLEKNQNKGQDQVWQIVRFNMEMSKFARQVLPVDKVEFRAMDFLNIYLT